MRPAPVSGCIAGRCNHYNAQSGGSIKGCFLRDNTILDRCLRWRGGPSWRQYPFIVLNRRMPFVIGAPLGRLGTANRIKTLDDRELVVTENLATIVVMALLAACAVLAVVAVLLWRA